MDKKAEWAILRIPHAYTYVSGILGGKNSYHRDRQALSWVSGDRVRVIM